jgi:hypothetical protein
MAKTMKLLQQIHIDSNTNMTKNASSSRVICMLMFSGLFLLTSFSHQAHSASKIVKWKDDKGMTHYGDSVPTQYSNRESSEISKQGITVKRFKPINAQDQAIVAANQEQDKKDKALVTAFTNANEIDLARDRNLQLDIVAIESLQLQKINSVKKLAENQSYANRFIKNNKPVPADLSADIKNNQLEVAKQEQLINERKAEMEKTRKRFDDDKLRFIALKSNTNEANNLPDATSTKP